MRRKQTNKKISQSKKKKLFCHGMYYGTFYRCDKEI